MSSSPEVLATRNIYHKKWYGENRERVLATRRQKYAADTNWVERAEARRVAVKVNNARVRAENRKFVDGLKVKPCVDCKTCFPPECMDFDHVRGKKLFGIGQMGQRNKELIMAEIKKCDLVCANCHRIRTRKRKQHGYGKSTV